MKNTSIYIQVQLKYKSYFLGRYVQCTYIIHKDNNEAAK